MWADELLVNSVFAVRKQVFALDDGCIYDGFCLIIFLKIPENNPVVVNDSKFLFYFSV